MERTTLEAAEMLEEYSDKSGDILGGFLSRALRETLVKACRESLFREVTYNILSVVSIRKADADGLVNEEDIRILVPGVGIVRDVVNIIHSARALTRSDASASRKRVDTRRGTYLAP